MIEVKDITVDDLKRNNLTRAKNNVKKQMYAIVQGEVYKNITQKVSVKEGKTETVDDFSRQLASSYTSDVMNGDGAIMQLLVTAFGHVVAYNKPDGKPEDLEKAELIINKVNKMNEKNTQMIVDKIINAVENEYNFDTLLGISGIGWGSVSELYLSIKDHRIIDDAYVKYFVQNQIFKTHAEEDNRLWLTHNELLKEIKDEILYDLYQEVEDVHSYLEDLMKRLSSDEGILTEVPLSSLGMVDDGSLKCYASSQYFKQMKHFFEEIYRIKRYNKPLVDDSDNLDKISQVIDNVEEENGFKFNVEQRTGIYGACQNSVFTITGLAGTGKSASVKSIVQVYEKLLGDKVDTTERIFGGSFTGQATNQLRQSVNLDATRCSTLHRWMSCNDFMDEDDMILPTYQNVKLLIIDEFSMVDLSLVNRVLNNISDNDKVNILFVGDIGQLRSINLGFALEFIQSNISQSTQYTKVVRQDEGSVIPKMANEVYEGRLPEDLIDDTKHIPKYKFISEITYESISRKASKVYEAYMRKVGDLTQVQILANTVRLVEKVNLDVQEGRLKEYMNVHDESPRYYETYKFKVYEGDRVIFTKNMVHHNSEGQAIHIFNGAKGVMKNINFNHNYDLKSGKISDIKSIVVEFDESHLGTLEIDDTSMLRYIVLGYAITVHKSQGSTIGDTILAIGEAPNLNNNQLVYTSMTRTANSLTCISSPNIIKKAIETDAYAKARYIYKDVLKALRQEIKV